MEKSGFVTGPKSMRSRALIAAALLAQLGAGDAFSYSARPAPGCLGPRVAGGCARLACPALPRRLREENAVSPPFAGARVFRVFRV